MGFSLRKHWRKQASIYSKVQQRSSSESHQLILEEEIYSKQDPCRMTARDLEDRSRPRVMKWSKDIIVNAVMEDSTKSTRQLSSDYNVSHATVWCILNTENFHPYKAIHTVSLRRWWRSTSSVFVKKWLQNFKLILYFITDLSFLMNASLLS